MSGFNALVGLRIIGREGEEFMVTLDVEERHHHDLGSVHGGVFLALADVAMARVAMSALENEPVQTVELKANFLRPFTSGTIAARGRIVSLGRRLVYTEARIKSDERLLATASATMMRNGNGEKVK
ncbi:PaaI family thioesterase [Sphingosinicella sp.]|uniref:PaaI family thioesterase n=1 Tax=Sphingosinicella sp. TaxID=1917971 RepID=UPI0017CDA2FB|nr:PaaI family thioesterase [Sphingosinicella sp.]MBA4759194.1 PaaI family thioesterase [Sphingosinicella sp.]